MVHVPPDVTEEEEFITYTAAHHQRTIRPDISDLMIIVNHVVVLRVKSDAAKVQTSRIHHLGIMKSGQKFMWISKYIIR